MNKMIKNLSNKRGFTLMELLVYMAIVGIVVIIAGQAFSDSTKMRIRTQGMIKANEIAENVATLFKDDAAQMGAKSAMTVNASEENDNYSAMFADVYMDPDNSNPSQRDSSSFVLTKNKFGAGLDSLVMRRIKYSSTGEIVRVEKIEWFVEGEKLMRSCTTTGNNDDGECVANVEVAEGVSKFSIWPAKPGVLSAEYATSSSKQYPRLLPSSTDTCLHSFQLIPRNDIDYDYYFLNSTASGSSVTLTNFISNYNFDNDQVALDGVKANQVYVVGGSETVSGSWKDVCTKIDSLQAGVEYEISFEVPYAANNSRAFCPGRDHMAVGFRYKETGAPVSEIDDFMFYPPATNAASPLRTMRFAPTTTVKNLCMAFTFASYSPLAGSAGISIGSLQLNKVESANYEFDESFIASSALDRRNVKAFRLDLQVKKSNEAGEISLVVPVPGNGPRD